MRWLRALLCSSLLSACAVIDGLSGGVCGDAEHIGVVDGANPMLTSVVSVCDGNHLDLGPCSVGGRARVFRFSASMGMYELCVSGQPSNVWVLASENRNCDTDMPDGVCAMTMSPCATFHISRADDSYLYVHAQPSCENIQIVIRQTGS